MRHHGRCARPAPRGVLAGHAVTAVVAILAASPLTVQQAPTQPPDSQQWRFCLKGTDADAKETCFTGTRPCDGPPTDPTVFEEQQQKLKEELARRAKEARKRLERFHGESNR